jgi:hypothetical protein
MEAKTDTMHQEAGMDFDLSHFTKEHRLAIVQYEVQQSDGMTTIGNHIIKY